MELAQRLHRGGGRIGYVADACVYHYHSESLKQVKRRFEREALALQKIMPQIHVRRRDLLRYIATSIWHDRSEERRVGEECVRTCRPRWSPYHFNNKTIVSNQHTPSPPLPHLPPHLLPTS